VGVLEMRVSTPEISLQNRDKPGIDPNTTSLLLAFCNISALGQICQCAGAYCSAVHIHPCSHPIAGIRAFLNTKQMAKL
jgi:hypothetical protein